MTRPAPDSIERAAQLYQTRRLDEAAELCERLLNAPGKTNGPAAHLAGLIAFERGNQLQGIELLERAIAAGVRSPTLHANLAICLTSVGRISEAQKQANVALAMDPMSASAHAALGDVLMSMGAVGESIAHLRQALHVERSIPIQSNILYQLNFLPGYSANDLAKEHRAFGAEVSNPLYRLVGHPNDPDPDRKLRVGYLSADMRSHSVAHFLAPLLEAHDRNVVDVIGFPSVKRTDAVTERLRSFCNEWIPVTHLSDDDAARAIRAAKIDILVELGGHTGDSRLMVLDRRPAPVQVAWCGYPQTTGLEAVRYRLTDAFVDPEGDVDRHYVETLVRLPSGFLCYEAPSDAPDVAPLPSASSNVVTFGSFNTLAKMTPKVVELWARIVRKAGNARLLLKANPLSDPAVCDYVKQQFAKHDFDLSRLVLEGRTSGQAAHLARYSEVDIALDPFPYNGTTTTCEALWMGVPVVSLEGNLHASRVTSALLKRVGLGSLVGTTPKQVQSIALELAKNRAKLADLRAGMRARLQGSSLCNNANFAREVEAAYRAMWQSFCRSVTAEPDTVSIGFRGAK
ncbi:MAG: glycosyltransferase [Polyangiaceae bacterium]|nr:glycosyltransferase [Polyangiaceae bacterium]